MKENERNIRKIVKWSLRKRIRSGGPIIGISKPLSGSSLIFPSYHHPPLFTDPTLKLLTAASVCCSLASFLHGLSYCFILIQLVASISFFSSFFEHSKRTFLQPIQWSEKIQRIGNYSHFAISFFIEKRKWQMYCYKHSINWLIDFIIRICRNYCFSEIITLP